MSGLTPVKTVTVTIGGVTHEATYYVQHSMVYVQSPLLGWGLSACLQPLRAHRAGCSGPQPGPQSETARDGSSASAARPVPARPAPAWSRWRASRRLRAAGLAATSPISALYCVSSCLIRTASRDRPSKRCFSTRDRGFAVPRRLRDQASIMARSEVWAWRMV